MIHLRKYILEKKYYFRNQIDRIPPYSYKEFCKKLSDNVELKCISMNKYLSLKDKKEKFMLIRHDVDHDIWTAKKMALIESENNIKSTFFILHTAPYFRNDLKQTIKICREIQSLGHEIGLHNDLITSFFRYNTDPSKKLYELMNLFKQEGINISGSVAHGSKFIQNANKSLNRKDTIMYANYFVFSEIYKEKLMLIKDKNLPSNLIFNDIKLNLPCINMNDFGLKYEAYFIHFDKYVSDSGRKFWSVGDDPLIEISNLSNGDVLQCLLHPIWWKYYLN